MASSGLSDGVRDLATLDKLPFQTFHTILSDPCHCAVALLLHPLPASLEIGRPKIGFPEARKIGIASKSLVWLEQSPTVQWCRVLVQAFVINT